MCIFPSLYSLITTARSAQRCTALFTTLSLPLLDLGVEIRLRHAQIWIDIEYAAMRILCLGTLAVLVSAALGPRNERWGFRIAAEQDQCP